MKEMIKLASQFKTRDNPNIETMQPMVGTVLSADPLQISIYNGEVVLTSDLCYVCSRLSTSAQNAKFVINSSSNNISGDGTITYKDILKAGDLVMCVPGDRGQKYFIVDKLI